MRGMSVEQGRMIVRECMIGGAALAILGGGSHASDDP